MSWPREAGRLTVQSCTTQPQGRGIAPALSTPRPTAVTRQLFSATGKFCSREVGADFPLLARRSCTTGPTEPGGQLQALAQPSWAIHGRSCLTAKYWLQGVMTYAKGESRDSTARSCTTCICPGPWTSMATARVTLQCIATVGGSSCGPLTAVSQV
jgi:hypothetical protein